MRSEEANSALISAARSGDIGGIRAALADGADIEGISPCRSSRSDAWAYTALGRAALKGHEEVAAYLLDRGANPNGGQVKPIAAASGENHWSVVRLLLSRGANPNLEFHNPLVDACVQNNSEMVALLLEKGADPRVSECPPMKFAAAHGNITMMEMLFKAGANPSQGWPDGLGALDTPLNTAVEESQRGAAVWLLGKGLSDESLAEGLESARLGQNWEMLELVRSYAKGLEWRKRRSRIASALGVLFGT